MKQTLKFKMIGSSETTRKLIIINNQFKEWFIGFVEGDGCLFKTKSNQLQFIINQKDPRVLIYIRENLKFGKISKTPTHYRYCVTKLEHLNTITDILNGRIHLKKFDKTFKIWLETINKKQERPINYIKNDNKVDLESAWISGFADAEGCFNIRISHGTIYNQDGSSINLKNKKQVKEFIETKKEFESISLRIRLRFILDLKWEKEILIQIKEIFEGSVNERKENMYRYTLDSNSKNKEIIKYFNKNNLKSAKYRDYKKWKDIYKEIEQKKHLKMNNIGNIERYLKISKDN